MDKVVEFLEKDAFSIAGFGVTFGLIIAVAVVLLAVLVLILVVSKHARRKRREAKLIKQMLSEPVDEEQLKAEVEEIKKEQEGNSANSVTEQVAPKTASKKVETKPTKRLNGKWVIVHKKDGEYLAVLLASNGEVMLTSETYSTPEGAKAGIATIIKGVENGNFIIYKDKSGQFYYKLKSATNKLLCAGEIYKTKDGCVSAVESVKRIAKDAIIISDILAGEEYIAYIPAKLNLNGKLAKGKWKIERDDNGYSARLYANNGQLMIATESVSQRATAEKAMINVKKNSLEGNFIIDKDKFGRFYYKLRNSQKSVICIGEAYDKLDTCISSLESVRKFAEISDLEK